MKTAVWTGHFAGCPDHIQHNEFLATVLSVVDLVDGRPWTSLVPHRSRHPETGLPWYHRGRRRGDIATRTRAGVDAVLIPIRLPAVCDCPMCGEALLVEVPD